MADINCTKKIPLPRSRVQIAHENYAKKPSRVFRNKNGLQLLIAFVLVSSIMFGTLIQPGVLVTIPTGNAGIDVTELEPITKTAQPVLTKHTGTTITRETAIETEPVATKPIIEEPIIEDESSKFFSPDITFDYTYVMPDDNMPYALYKPSSATDEEPMALLVWLHGSGERDIDYNTFLTRGLPAVINNWSLDGFNAYILCPHLTGEYDNTWNTSASKTNLQKLLDAFVAEYNIDMDNIVIAGHSLGGQGVLYMTHEMPDYFNRAAVLSGYDPDINESEITTPIMNYIGTHDAGEDATSIRYTMTTLATTFGHNNTVQIESSHGDLPLNVFTLDTTGDNESDIIKWLFAEKASDSDKPTVPDANKTIIDSVPLFFQTDYPDIPYSEGTVATSGCGISCLSMVASYQTGIIYTPGTLAKYNYSGYDNGTRMENAAIALGLNFEKSWYWSDVIEALENEQLVIVLVGGNTIFTNGGHFIVLTGITNDGQILVNDPYEPNYNRIGSRYFTGFDQSEFTCDFNGAWIFDKKN